MLSGLGVRDERLYAILLGAFDREPEVVASLLARYGDRRALPHLRERRDAFVVDERRGPFGNRIAIELPAAIEELGETLTDEQVQKREAAISAARRAARIENRIDAMIPPAEEEESEEEAIRADALRRFAESPYAKGLPDAGWIDVSLRYGHDYEGATLATFDADAMREVLFGLFPRKVSCEPSDAAGIVQSLRAFWTFAKEELHLPNAEECLAELGDSAIPELERELANPDNFGLGKSVFMTGKARGFDVETKAGLEEWLEVYNQEQARSTPAADRGEAKRKKRLRKLKKQAKRRNRR